MHKLLTRQLNRLELNVDAAPNLEQWQAIIDRVNKTYLESDQERYLLERSMVISSREMRELHDKLIESARRAGMADVATSTLHNVGNILNSANVSLSLIHENTLQPFYARLFMLEDILEQHATNLTQYFAEDEKGKLIPAYLIEVLKKIKTSHQALSVEVVNLKAHLEHIKEITALQKEISGISSVSEKVFIPEMLDITLKMSGISFKNDQIKVDRNYDKPIFIISNKSKLMQIIVNVLQNAKDALELSTNPKKHISITVEEHENKTVSISIEDNGIGITDLNLKKLFTFGFTTKKTGHGFGMHSSAISAHELGGKIEAESNGLNHGARFILTLPTAPIRKKDD